MKIAKPRRCKVCHNEFIPSMTTQKVCGLHCAIKLSQEKEKAKRDKQSGKDLREFNQKNLKWQHNLTQKSFNRMRVLQELKWFAEQGLPPTCISCGKENMDWCCGHHKTVKHSPELRYDCINTNLQCNMYCNKGLSGNISGNKTTRGQIRGMIDKFGPLLASDFMSYLKSKHDITYTCEKLESMRKQFNKTIRELENANN